jgi:pimeloyl-ACP methyl ester carboxylesterase
VLVAVLLAGCGPTADQPPTASSSPGPGPVPHACVYEWCRGRVGDNLYLVQMPARWNGSLMLFSQGFYRVWPRPGMGSPTPIRSGPGPVVVTGLLDRGFGVAAGTYAWAGWSPDRSVAAMEAAYRYVRARVGQPYRVYAWGESMGGLAAVLLAERHPEWVSGAASACGVLAGTIRFYDRALDVAYAVRQLLAPGMAIAGYRSYQAAGQANRIGGMAIRRASHGSVRDRAVLLLIGALVDAPAATGHEGGHGSESRMRAAGEAITSALGFDSYAHWQVDTHYGGEIADNSGVDYASRLDGPERKLVESMAPGLTDAALRKLAVGARVHADPAARAAAGRQEDPTGVLGHPLVTLHTADDPVAPVAHEGAYRALVAEQGRSGELMQLVSVPPSTFSGPVAPYGAGHCRFTTSELLGLVSVLTDWVGTATRPDAAAVRAAFGTPTGLDLGYHLPPWPAAR